MNKKELRNKLDKELNDNDIIDYLNIISKDHNELDIEKTSHGYSIISYYKPINYKHHNNPSNDL